MDTNIERIVDALDRIANALETGPTRDDLDVLSDDGGVLAMTDAQLESAWRTNGMTVLYRHPEDDSLVIVARPNPDTFGGWDVSVEIR